MKHIPKAVLLAAVLVLLVPGPAMAGDYISEAAEALKTSSVYVAPGTEDTDIYTSGKLQNILRDGDNIVLVMLPSEAEEGTDINAMVVSLSEKLGNQRIIGLAVGKKVVGYSPLLPSGVAADQMRRANSVSNDPITALVTFAQNMHIWLGAHPQPTLAPTATPRPTPTPTPRPLTPEEREAQTSLFLAAAGLAILGMMLGLFASRARLASIRRLRVLKPTELLIENLRIKVGTIVDSKVRGDLTQACLIALGLVEAIQHSKKPQGYLEEKFPELIGNMDKQVKALLAHESGRRPLQPETLQALREVLLGYDNLFVKFQAGNPQANDLLASIIDSNNAMITELGYRPDVAKKK